MLAEIDVLVYDIQDVGARIYTYEWTLALAANAAKKPIIVLDRPDPIRADRVEGNILDPKFASLVGQFPVALRYGLTPGELLRFLAGTKLIDADVHVVPMKGYRRSMWFDETGIPWVNPSPNLRNVRRRAALSGHGLLRGDVGDGRARHRRSLHADRRVVDDGQRRDRRGAQCAQAPRRSLRYGDADDRGGLQVRGQTIPMIKVRVDRIMRSRPVELGVRMLRAIYAAHPRTSSGARSRSTGWRARTSYDPPSNRTRWICSPMARRRGAVRGESSRICFITDEEPHDSPPRISCPAWRRRLPARI